jgi:hypothetical protein
MAQAWTEVDDLNTGQKFTSSGFGTTIAGLVTGGRN